MSATISLATAKPYGIQRVCKVWDVSRSTFYTRKARLESISPAAPAKRGPKTLLSDEELLDLIRDDLATSPFKGEGHRKVWARLRFVKGHNVGRKRVLRIMRENHLLSPYRVPQGAPNLHEGKIITLAPNVMWGTDATKVFTLEDGWCWIFTAIEHWNAECVGWHITKTGNRFSALEPISMGLIKHYGSVQAAVARGLTLRMDNGSQYLSEHFQNQIKFWGIAPSFAFVREPETNGVVERFNRTLKEQAIYGRTFRTIEEVRAAMAIFVNNYNQLWQVEKLNFKSPDQAREDFYKKAA
jgi:transposase InsO family protein